MIVGIVPTDILENEGRLYDPTYTTDKSYTYRRQLTRIAVINDSREKTIHLTDAGHTEVTQMSQSGLNDTMERLVTT